MSTPRSLGLACLTIGLAIGRITWAAPSPTERLADDVYVVRDDALRCVSPGLQRAIDDGTLQPVKVLGRSGLYRVVGAVPAGR